MSQYNDLYTDHYIKTGEKMARLNRYQIMELYKEEIKKTLSKEGKVFALNDIKSIFVSKRSEWHMPNVATYKNFIEFLVEQKKWLIPIEIPRGIRYILQIDEIISPDYVASHIYPDSYLSHYSAVSFHGLTGEIIKTIFSSREHAFSNRSELSDLDQQHIDNAFSKEMRKSNQYFEYNKQRIYVLSSKDGQLGIKETNGIRVTTIERTLIDITVRPEYSGGVYEVLNIFINAKGKFSANKLRSLLLQLNYSYPYHQCLGFYLEIAGYPDDVLNLFKSMPIKLDFYLTYNIQDAEYNDTWKIHYPKHFAQ